MINHSLNPTQLTIPYLFADDPDNGDEKFQNETILIVELASPPVQSAESYLLIKMLLNKYYPVKPELGLIKDNDISQLAAVI